MGTEITLDVGGMSIDWSKNFRGRDHGALFQKDDRCEISSEYIDDDAVDRLAFVRCLDDVVPRLDLMGFGQDAVSEAYRRAIADPDVDAQEQLLTFVEFQAFVNAQPIEDLDDTLVSGSNPDDIMGRFARRQEVSRIPRLWDRYDGYSERSYFASLLGFLHPHAILRLLAGCSNNRSENVVWAYGPLVSAGWAAADEFQAGARRAQTFLIATEGSSDTKILRHAFELLRPNVRDFFRFIDMTDGYPFAGAGSLKNFATGLVRMDTQDKVLFLLDNDAEGREACDRIRGLSLPPNMRATCLPDLEDLRTVPAHGPSGVQVVDINGSAAAIECYLDLRADGQPPPQVRWTNYKRRIDAYQGALEQKDAYASKFLNQTSFSLTEGTYSPANMVKVLDHIFTTCCEIAADTNKWAQLPVRYLHHFL